MLEKQTTTPFIQRLLALGVVVYITMYAFESPIRYQLNLMGLDGLIFIRDAILVFALMFVFLTQAFNRKVHKAYWFYFFVIAFHGAVLVLNVGSFPAVAYSAKMLMSMLFGAIAAQILLQPSRRMLIFFSSIWAVTVFGLFINKYDIVVFPWIGMKTTLLGVDVNIQRSWTMPTGLVKRASGFARESVYASILVSFLALYPMFFSRSTVLKIIVVATTLVATYWTTQKGAILSFFFVSAILALGYRRFVPVARVWISALFIFLCAPPLILPGYVMPETGGQFSMMSFYLRVQFMWPMAWKYLEEHQFFPLGVGLGSIGGAQRFYEMGDAGAADNLFVFLYVSCGVMAFVYLGWIFVQLTRLRDYMSRQAMISLAIIAFVLGNGVFMSMIEDQMATLFMGAALAMLYTEAHRASLPKVDADTEISQKG